jgi:hypothetical protein
MANPYGPLSEKPACFSLYDDFATPELVAYHGFHQLGAETSMGGRLDKRTPGFGPAQDEPSIRRTRPLPQGT